MKRVSIITGGAGFVGANLVPYLLSEGRKVLVVDNLCRGRIEYLDRYMQAHPEQLFFLKANLDVAQDIPQIFERAFQLGKVDEVWHLAANADIPAGVLDAQVDLRDTFMTTFNILEGMKQTGIKTFHFASSSAIYGDLGDAALHEAIGPLLPISNYGAMKLASEANASAAAEAFLDRVHLFRFPNVVGVPATHGVIYDFVNKLIKTPEYLQVLGNGTQQKAYLYVSDLILGMLQVRSRAISGKVEVVNIGPVDEGVTVKWIAERVVARVSPHARISYGEGGKGWVGDVPKFHYSTQKIQSYGWQPLLNSEGAVKRAIDEIATQCGV